ncbi:MAG: YadA C-terminal domain-containing protein [Cetobacterium sp.]|uniref:YadA C-terminal domain-containing protein n=1 Tax=Cetobacterium sp. TaxID=2071632 RepID=UPI003EE6BC29
MKKIAIVAAIAGALGFAATANAADSHTNWQGSVAGLKDSVVIRDASAVEDLIKYTDAKTAAKLRAAFKEDGKLTAAEIKASGISDHHFYTGYLAAATTQAQYDARLKEMNGGKNMDDNFVSNRDLKAHGSMLMNQVDSKVQVVVNNQAKIDKEQDQKLDHLLEGQDITNDYVSSMDKDLTSTTDRLDKVVDGLKDLGNFIQAQTPSLPEEGGQITGTDTPPPPTVDYDDTQIKGDIAAVGDAVKDNAGKIEQNKNDIAAVGNAVKDNAGKIEQNKQDIASVGSAVQANANNIAAVGSAVKSNSDRIDANSARLDAVEQWQSGIDSRLDKMDKKMSSGIAGVAAMANIPSPAVAGTTTVGAGLGHFNSETSVAVGASTYFNNGVSLKGSLAAGSELVVGAGVGYTW